MLLASHNAPEWISGGDLVISTEFSLIVPEKLFVALEESFPRIGHPGDLNLFTLA